MTEATTVYEFLKQYVNGTLGKQTKCGNWSVMNWGNMDVLQYFSENGGEHRGWRHKEQTEPERIAYKLTDGSVIFNANELEFAVTYSYGRKTNRFGNQTDAQRWLEELGATPIPFTLFDEVEGADVRDFSWVFKPTKENVKVIDHRERRNANGDLITEPIVTLRHFVGACLFMIGDETFLFDVDRQELNHGIFNPFLTKLPKKATTIDEAYAILMPGEVREAIANGIEVVRQGEFYFVKHSDECPVKPDLTDEERQILKFPPSRIGYGIIQPGQGTNTMWRREDVAPFGGNYPENTVDDLNTLLDTPEKREFQKAALKYKVVFDKLMAGSATSGTLGKSSTGSHSVEKYVKVGEDAYASGKVSQQRRQHADLNLNGWYKVIPNTGVLSWTITGKID